MVDRWLVGTLESGESGSSCGRTMLPAAVAGSSCGRVGDRLVAHRTAPTW